MAKFDISRLSLQYPDRIITSYAELIHGKPGPCWHCGEETEWIDIDFEAHLCSDECLSAKIDEYLEAMRHGNTKRESINEWKDVHSTL